MGRCGGLKVDDNLKKLLERVGMLVFIGLTALLFFHLRRGGESGNYQQVRCGNLVCEEGEGNRCPDCLEGVLMVTASPIRNLDVDHDHIYYHYCRELDDGDCALGIYRMPKQGGDSEAIYQGFMHRCEDDLLVDGNYIYVACRPDNQTGTQIMSVSVKSGELKALATIAPGEDFYHLLMGDYRVYWITLAGDARGTVKVYSLLDGQPFTNMDLENAGVSKDIQYVMRGDNFYYAYSGPNQSLAGPDRGVALAVGDKRLIHTDREPGQLNWVGQGQEMGTVAALENSSRLPNVYNWEHLFYMVPHPDRDVYNSILVLDTQSEEVRTFVGVPFNKPSLWEGLRMDAEGDFLYYLYRGNPSFIARRWIGN